MQSIQFSFAWNHSKNGKILHTATISNELLLDDMISYETNTSYFPSIAIFENNKN